MKKATVRLRGASPYTQGKYIQSKKQAKETHDEFENRIWKERAHYNSKGECFIPPMVFKNCIAEAAKFLSMPIPGEGKKTFTKPIERGIMVTEPAMLGINIDDVTCQVIPVPSDGRRGGTTRVIKHFPIFPEWEVTVEFIILDERINENIFREHIEEAGKFIGIGTFRPQSNGYHGRFEVIDIKFL